MSPWGMSLQDIHRRERRGKRVVTAFLLAPTRPLRSLRYESSFFIFAARRIVLPGRWPPYSACRHFPRQYAAAVSSSTPAPAAKAAAYDQCEAMAPTPR